MKDSFYQRHEAAILGAVTVVAVLAAWEIAWETGKISSLFFSGPSTVLKQIGYAWREGNLKSDLAYSGRNFVLGLSAAVIAGVVLGILIGWYNKLRMVVEPLLTALNATPRIAMMPLILIWFGIDYRSKVFVIFISAIFPVLVNTIGGMRALDRDLLRAARAFCASDWQIFKTVALPGSVPFILTGVKQAVALGLIGVTVGEMFGGSEGIGFMVMYGGQSLSTEVTFAGVTIIATAGIILTWLAERLERRFSRWRPER